MSEYVPFETAYGFYRTFDYTDFDGCRATAEWIDPDSAMADPEPGKGWFYKSTCEYENGAWYGPFSTETNALVHAQNSLI